MSIGTDFAWPSLVIVYVIQLVVSRSARHWAEKNANGYLCVCRSGSNCISLCAYSLIMGDDENEFQNWNI